MIVETTIGTTHPEEEEDQHVTTTGVPIIKEPQQEAEQ